MAVELTTLCRDLGVLPGPGGLLDQDAYHVWLIRETLGVLNEKERQDVEKAQAKAKIAGRKH
jgi:hypothetical protein